MKIVVLDGYTLNPGDLSWDALTRLGETVIYERTPVGQVVERCQEAEIVFTNKTVVSADAIKQLPGLRYIGVLATGYNIVDVSAAVKQDITVSNVPTYGTYSVAQLVFALLLELCHHVQEHSHAVLRGDWSRSKDFCFWNYPLIELQGKTMGIIGLGRIGSRVASIAEDLGMHVIYADINAGNSDLTAGYKQVSVPELLAEADVVSLHCPLTSENTGMINRESLKLMKPSAFLINTSRGKLVVDQDLAEALATGQIAGAGLDVLTVEPPPADNPLLHTKNIIITPHIAWATKEARQRLMDAAVQNLKHYLDGNPINVVNQ